MRSILLLGLAFASWCPASAADARGSTQATLIGGTLVVDGGMSDPQWGTAPPLPLGACDAERAAEHVTWAKLLFSPTHLYVGFHCAEPDTAGMPAQATQRDGEVWQDDSVEVFVRPDEGPRYHQIALNSRGIIYDAVGKDRTWNGAVEAATQVVEGRHWQAVLRIALADIGACVGEGQSWRVNLYRTRIGRGGGPTQEYAWSMLDGRDYHAVDQFGTVRGIAIPSRPDGVTRIRQAQPDSPEPSAARTRLYRFSAGGAQPPLQVIPGTPALIPVYLADADRARITLRLGSAVQAERRLELRMADGTRWGRILPAGANTAFELPELGQGITHVIVSSAGPAQIEELLIDRRDAR